MCRTYCYPDRTRPSGFTSAVFLLRLALLFCLYTGTTAGADDAVVVGIVEEFKGLSRDYKLLRGGQQLGLRICDQIQAGDSIKIPPDHSVKIRLTTGERLEYSERQSEQPIESRGAQA